MFYTALAGVDLYSLPSSVAQSGPASGSDLDGFVKDVGRKSSQTDGMTFSREGSLYYGGLEENAIFKWEAARDVEDQVGGWALVALANLLFSLLLLAAVVAAAPLVVVF